MFYHCFNCRSLFILWLMSDSSGLLSVTTTLSKPLSHFIAYLTACTPGESLADFCMIDRSEFRHICGPPSLVLRKRQSFICLTPQLDKSMLTIIMRMSNVQCSLLARGCHHRLSAFKSSTLQPKQKSMLLPNFPSSPLCLNNDNYIIKCLSCTLSN